LHSRRPWLLFFLLLLSCDLSRSIQQTSDKAVSALQDAINSLEKQSGAWQGTLTNLEKDLVAQGQSTLANEVQNLAARGIATGGVELRCNADFVGTRMRQGLQRILAGLKGTTAPPIVPAFCQVVPTTVDLALRPDRLKEVDFYGYDLDAANEHALKMFVEQAGGQLVPIPASKLATPTHYLTTINVSVTNGVSFNANSERIVIKAGTQVLSTLHILQPPAPTPCGALGQRCCAAADNKPPCGSASLSCSGGTCAAVACGGLNQPTCTSGTACQGGFTAIEGKCRQVTQLESTSEGCGESVMRWVSTSGFVSISKSSTRSFFVQKGGNEVWHCGTGITNDRTGCPVETNYLTVHRDSDRGASVICSMVSQ